MISENFVEGDNVYLNELRAFFFEVLGMMSITHYGAIGDGRTDNYTALQVAIDDANRRHLCYIYVPYGLFRFRGELLHRDNITFIGNPKARIFNDKTGEEIEITQFGVMGGCGAVESLIFDLELVDGAEPDFDSGSYFTGRYKVIINGNAVIPSGTPFYWDNSAKTITWSNGTAIYSGDAWVVNVTNTENRSIMTAKLVGTHTIQATAGSSLSTELLELTQSKSLGDGFTLENGKIVVGSGIGKVLVSANTVWETLDDFNGQPKRVHLKKNDAIVLTNELWFETTQSEGMFVINIPPYLMEVEEGDTISLEVVGSAGEKIYGYILGEDGTYLTVDAVEYDEPEQGGDTMRKLTSNLVLEDNVTPTLTEGFYYTGRYFVYTDSVSDANKVIGQYEMFYYDPVEKAVVGTMQKLVQVDGLWYYVNDQPISDSVALNTTKVPTSAAVYQAIQNISPSGTNATELTKTLYLQNDGTIKDIDNNLVTLNDGFYWSDEYQVVITLDSSVAVGNFQLFYYNSDDKSFYSENFSYFYSNNEGKWITESNDTIEGTLSDSNFKIPTSKAVRDYIATLLNNNT